MNEVLFVYKTEIDNLQLDLISAAVDAGKGQDIGARVGKMLAKAHVISDAVGVFVDAHDNIFAEDSARVGHYLDSIEELHRASFDLAHKYSFEIRYQ